jgi:hypothetical protein
MVVMFTKRTTVAIFALVMALMLITASSYASSASAEKVGHKGKKSSIDHASTPTSSTTSKRDLKSLSDCESKAAKNGGLTQAQVDDCYNQLFPREKVSQTLQSTPTQGHQSTSPLDQTLQSTPTQGQQSTPTQGQQSTPTQGHQSTPTQGHQSTSPLDQTLQSTPTQGQLTSALEHQTGFPFK